MSDLVETATTKKVEQDESVGKEMTEELSKENGDVTDAKEEPTLPAIATIPHANGDGKEMEDDADDDEDEDEDEEFDENDDDDDEEEEDDDDDDDDDEDDDDVSTFVHLFHDSFFFFFPCPFFASVFCFHSEKGLESS